MRAKLRNSSSSSQPQPAYAAPIAEAPTQIWLPVPARPSRRRWLPLLSLGLLAAFMAMAAGLIGGAVLLYYSDWILPGVTTLGVELGGQTTDEALVALEQNWKDRAIILDAEESSWQVTPAELGITLDAAVTIDQAHKIGRTTDSFLQWLQAGGQADLVPVWQIDLGVAETGLLNLASRFEVAPQNAGVTLETGRFVATPPRDGRKLDVASNRQWLGQSAAEAVLSGHLQLPTTVIPPATTDVSQVVEEANQLLETAVTIRAYDPVTDETVDWTISPEEWGHWLQLSVDPTDPAQFSWMLDEAQAQGFLADQTPILGNDRYVDVEAAVTAVNDFIENQTSAASLRIFHHPRQHIVQAGETFASIGRAYGLPYPWIQQANPGVSDALFAGQLLTIPSPDALIPLPVVENKRLIVSISQQKMWAYENGAPKWEWLTSTGIADSPTSPGIFQIQTHEPNAYAGNWDLWMPYFMGIYQPVPTSSFMNGFHGFPTRDGQNLLWTSSLGHQVTYGCILVSTANAAQLYEWAEEGVIVEIRP